jgi:lysophospholipid hydrolase
MVGGVSIGSLVRGMYSLDAHSVSVFGQAKSFAGRMASKWRMPLDLTYPITAWFTGAECKWLDLICQFILISYLQSIEV